ncbi:hypothetical protein [Glutamicibacter arilaitensis]|uniref:hypothetical protein n=1 Tax=Glutamicibacter arilaitensis TaxID=256701 RepID=UPI00384B62ED
MLGKVHQPKGGEHLQDWANALAAEYMDVVTKGMASHERSHQKLIGPSEIGVPCDRALLNKLAQTEEPDRGPAWRPQVGTALHTQMEEWFGKLAETWFVEDRVEVGRIGSAVITGSTDLFYRSGAVLDHKFVGPTRLRGYKGKGPGQQYRAQAHLYGRGWALDGFPVKIVMICFLPRDGELDDSFFWWEPYDEQVALDALDRANKYWNLIELFGLEEAIKMFAPCEDQWCPWCAPANKVTAAKARNPFAV